MQQEVPRSRSGSHSSDGVFFEFSATGIKLVDDHLVESQIGCESEFLAGVQADAVCMGCLLTGCLTAAFMLLQARLTNDFSALVEPQRDDITTHIVGD